MEYFLSPFVFMVAGFEGYAGYEGYEGDAGYEGYAAET